MTAKDQLKLLKAGFTIIRADENQLLIKFKDKNHLNWNLLSNGAKSKAELRRRMDTFLQSDLTVED
jgi:hypothetical protein